MKKWNFERAFSTVIVLLMIITSLLTVLVFTSVISHASELVTSTSINLNTTGAAIVDALPDSNIIIMGESIYLWLQVLVASVLIGIFVGGELV